VNSKSLDRAVRQDKCAQPHVVEDDTFLKESQLSGQDAIWQRLLELRTHWKETYDVILRALLFLTQLGAVCWLFEIQRQGHVAIV